MNPGYGFFGVAPGTGWKTNPNAMRTLYQRNSIFTNVALIDDGDVWWEGYSEAAPDHLTDWKRRDWTLTSDEPAAHPNARDCTPISQCPIAPEWDDPDGVPISALFFGGRRAGTVPLITQARDWQHVTFLAATLSSETTAAATGEVGVVRRDPMAMLPFLGYADSAAPLRQLVPPRRRRPVPVAGFGENSRALTWAIDRIEGRATETPIGYVPTPDALPLKGLDIPTADVEAVDAWFDTIGDRLPDVLRDELAHLRHHLG